MLQVIQANFNRFFTRGHERTVKAKKNIFLSILIKGGSVFISLILIPLTINYVNPTQYGVWLTLSSLITWVGLFDMGLGNGLKNKLTEVITLNDMHRAHSYVSSTYAILVAISACMLLAFYVINPYINWQSILNVSGYTGLNNLVLIIFTFFCFQFVIQLINNVLAANQAPAKSALMNIIAQGLSLVAIMVLIRLQAQGSLTNLVIIMAGMPLLIMLAGSLYYYRGTYKSIAPGFRFINLKYTKEMFKVGGTFFIIQIAALVLYETDNIVITQLFGPTEVTTFNVAYKLFSTVLMFFVIVITPFWSAFTEAYTKNDYEWIRNTVNKINKLWLGLSICTLLLLALSPWLYKLWLGDAVSVPFGLSVAMCFSTITVIWQAIHVQLLNGIGKIRLQLYVSIGCTLLNVPLSVFLGHKLGIAGIPLSNTILFVVMGVLFSVQTNKIINRKASGIFNA
jgi:O-antigen/teichoic acid export membrane protein